MTDIRADVATHPTLDAARSGDARAFASLTEPHRRELLTHCYRMLGSLQDAEDQVQETFLRAWRRLETYEGRAPFRAWLYRIATNACIDIIKQRSKRGLPADLYPPSDPTNPLKPPIMEAIWIEPFPDKLGAPEEANPEARYDWRESISLAFMVALQDLPPRQRCALIMADVLDWRADELAQTLEITIPAVNSLLHRARLKLKQRYPSNQQAQQHALPDDARLHTLLDRYMQAWEAADVDGIVSMLKEDATFPMPPLPSWFSGHEAIRTFISTTILAGKASGRWRLLPVRANGSPGFGFYMRDEKTGTYGAYAIQVLGFEGELLSDVTTFGYPQLFPFFGLPAEVRT